MPLVIYGLGGEQTYTHIHTHIKHTHIRTYLNESDFKKPGVAMKPWRAPGLEINIETIGICNFII